MATELSTKAEALSKGISQKPQLIFTIDGIDTVYGVGKVTKFIRIGDPGLFIGDSWVIGGSNLVEDQEDLISFEGTTTTITQQLLQDKGGTSSVAAIQVALLDKDGKASELVSPGVIVDDVLGRKAQLYLGYQGTSFPEDFVQIFSGIIDSTDSSSLIKMNVAHPEAGKRFDIFQKGSSKLSAPAQFRSANIQKILYRTRRDVVGTVTVAYTGGGTAGAEVVSVVGNAISVQIQNGVSTTSQIRNKLENSLAALSLVTVKVDEGQTAATCVTQGATNLASDTVLNLELTAPFLEPGDGDTFKTYVRIGDEIIEYTGKTSTQLTGCTREAFVLTDPRSYGDSHNTEDDVNSFYRLQGNAFDLALKIMLSREDDYFIEDVKIDSIGQVPDIGDVPNAIYFAGRNIADRYGIVVGDFVSTFDDADPLNNFVLRTVIDVQSTATGSYLIVDGAALVLSPLTEATVSIKSKYNVLPAGCGLSLGGDQVDVPEFERLRELFFASLLTYDFYLTETEKGKEFIDTDILFPTGAYTLPRKGKISVGFTSPPLAVSILPIFDSSNVTKPKQNVMRRTINKYFYNAVTYKFNPSVLEPGKFNSGVALIDADSKTRIKVPNKPFAVIGRGIRPTAGNLVVMDSVSRRLLERYKFAAEFTKITAFYGDAWAVDVGDPILFGDEQLKLLDSRRGKPGFTKRIFEVLNKSLNILTGEVILDLIDTNYLTSGRFGVIGPGTVIGEGSTTTSLKLTNSYGNDLPRTEGSKWSPTYVGEKVLVHDENWTFAEEVTFVRLDPSDSSRMLVDPPLSIPPTAGMLIDMPNYPGPTANDGAAYKNLHCFFNPSVDVVSGASEREFDVDPAGTPRLFVGATIIVENADFTDQSVEAKIESIVGDTVTVDRDLGFIPDNTHMVGLIGFVDDEGPAYRYI